MSVGIVVVSHSETLACGVVELCAQMAADVAIVAAGGDDDGGIGTSFDKIMAGIADADSGDGAVLITDLGSADLTAQSALEFVDAEQAALLRLADAPLVEGALAATTTAAGGADVDAVLAAAEAEGRGAAEVAGAAAEAAASSEGSEGEGASTTVVLPNPLGLHARPAAAVVAALRGLDVRMMVTNTATDRSAPANSMLSLTRLEAAGGTEIRITADGADATQAVERVAAMAADGFGEVEEPSTTATEEEAAPTAAISVGGVGAGAVLVGVGAAPGLALGPAARPEPAAFTLPEQRHGHDPRRQRDVLTAALDRARTELRTQAESRGGDIFVAHLEILDDPAVIDAVGKRVDEGEAAAWAWQDVMDEHAAALSGAANAVFAARALDVADVARRVLRHLVGASHAGATVPFGSVVVADDLVPSDVPALVESGAVAAVLGRGGRTSHVAVLARNLGLPLVVGVGAATATIDDGVLLVVDGSDGRVIVGPDDDAQSETRAAIAAAEAERRRLREAAGQPAATADGTRVVVAANASTVAEAQAAVNDGADGIGLLRTEFLFTDRDDLPAEDVQVTTISGICAAMEGRPVIVRTLDVGGDKSVPSLDLDPIRNGFLGVRGLRLSLTHPELLGTQLRALLRVASAHPISVMFPMVTSPDEVVAARAAIDAARASLSRDRVLAGEFDEVGIMVEVPAAALDAAAFTDLVDFFSVGTNDLTAYTMAADRTLPDVAALYRPDHPVVLGLIGRLCEAANAAGRWVGVCGELAGNVKSAAELVRLGVRELSMAPSAIPAVKARLRDLDLRL